MDGITHIAPKIWPNQPNTKYKIFTLPWFIVAHRRHSRMLHTSAQRAPVGANNGIKLFGYNSGSIICVNDLCNTHTYDYTVCFVMNMRRECCNCNALKPFPLSLDLTWEDKQDFTLGEPKVKISFNLFWFVCNWRLPTVPSNPIVTMSIPAPALSLKVCSLETKFAASYICILYIHDDDHLYTMSSSWWRCLPSCMKIFIIEKSF